MAQLEERLYTIEDAVRALGGVSQWTLRAHLKRGTVSAVRIGRRLFINRDEIRRIQSEGLPSLAAEAESAGGSSGTTDSGEQKQR